MTLPLACSESLSSLRSQRTAYAESATRHSPYTNWHDARPRTVLADFHKQCEPATKAIHDGDERTRYGMYMYVVTHSNVHIEMLVSQKAMRIQNGAFLLGITLAHVTKSSQREALQLPGQATQSSWHACGLGLADIGWLLDFNSSNCRLIWFDTLATTSADFDQLYKQCLLSS